jgi:hypothetical protein
LASWEKNKAYLRFKESLQDSQLKNTRIGGGKKESSQKEETKL